MHDDLQMMRQLEMEKCFLDKQFPCRWVPDMGFGYGYPLFNFYPPLPYYVGQLFRLTGFTFADTAKILFALQFFLSGAAMFVLGADLWGAVGGLLSAVFYIWAPYHSVDVFVRGAMNEAWAFVWFPLIFWAIKKLIEKEKFKYLFWLAFSYAMLLLTHNLMVMIFTPMMIVWILFWMAKEKKLPWQNWLLFWKMFFAGIWAIGLAAFFTLPAFVESKHIQIESMFSGYFDWRAHFTSIDQLFISRFWGWGPSLWGMEDGMPFPVGQIHWVLGLVILLLVVYRLVKQKKKQNNWFYWLIIGLFISAIGYTFLTHQQSVFVWKIIKVLQMAQFPWRLLTGTAFFFSLLAGSFYYLTKKKLITVALLLLVTIWNWGFFRPEAIGPMTDAEKFSGKAWEYQQTAGIYDYLPRTTPKAPIAAPKSDWLFLEGEASGSFKKGTNWLEWQGTVAKEGVLQVSTLYFPGWKVWVNDMEKELSFGEDLGRMTIPLGQGSHKVYFRLTNTPVRSVANLASLLSWLFLLVSLTKKGKKWLKLA